MLFAIIIRKDSRNIARKRKIKRTINETTMFVQIHYASINGDNEPCYWWCQTAYGNTVVPQNSQIWFHYVKNALITNCWFSTQWPAIHSSRIDISEYIMWRYFDLSFHINLWMYLDHRIIYKDNIESNANSISYIKGAFDLYTNLWMW